MRYVTTAALAFVLGLSACSSSNDKTTPTTPTTPTTGPNAPVTGEFHDIKPADME